MEALEYVVGTIHASGFRRVFRPMRFTPNAADCDAVKAEGLMIAKDGLAMIDKGLADKDLSSAISPSPIPRSSTWPGGPLYG